MNVEVDYELLECQPAMLSAVLFECQPHKPNLAYWVVVASCYDDC